MKLEVLLYLKMYYHSTVVKIFVKLYREECVVQADLISIKQNIEYKFLKRQNILRNKQIKGGEKKILREPKIFGGIQVLKGVLTPGNDGFVFISRIIWWYKVLS